MNKEELLDNILIDVKQSTVTNLKMYEGKEIKEDLLIEIIEDISLRMPYII